MKKIFLITLLTCCTFLSFLDMRHIGAAIKKNEGEKIVETAKKYIGNPYVYGGSSLLNGCDCSHFVWLVLQEALEYDGPYVTSYGFELLGWQIQNIQQAEAGDIICYGSHVAIYDGNDMIIEAKGTDYGITYDSKVDCMPIVTIRRII